MFDSLGRWVGTIRPPADVDLAAIGRNIIVGIRRDDDGVNHIVGFRLPTVR
jgi:hypothetical protein